jgi:hypothetical protein
VGRHGSFTIAGYNLQNLRSGRSVLWTDFEVNENMFTIIVRTRFQASQIYACMWLVEEFFYKAYVVVLCVILSFQFLTFYVMNFFDVMHDYLAT